MNIANKIWKLYLEYLRIFSSKKYAKHIGVKFGKSCNFVRPNFGTEPYLITIGEHVTIAKDVYFITHDGAVWIFREDEPDIDLFGPITIGDNVMIGLGAKILP